MAISTAVGTDRRSRVVGYEVQKGNFQEGTENLPMRVAILGQANTDNQSGLTNAPVEIFSAAQAAEEFGYGSQIHTMARILRNPLGDITGGIPTIVYPQVAPTGVAHVVELTVTGTSTGSASHILSVCGRSLFDGGSLEFAIADGDTATEIASIISDAVNNAIGCPVSASADAGVVTLTSKWISESTTEIDIEVSTENNPAGVSYATVVDTAGTGDSSAEISSSLALFGNEWNTIVLNPYPASRDGLFEAFNGVPGEKPASGRYAGIVFKPFVCLRGSKTSDSVANVIAGLNADQATVAQCVAPASKVWNAEIAASYATLLARQAQDTPHLDIAGQFLPDIPTPAGGSAGVFNDYNNRDAILKGGSSTAVIQNGRYMVEDFATTYHPVGENPPQFAYVRTLIQDWNVRYSVYLLELINVVDHAIVEDRTIVTVAKTVKPKQWRAVLNNMYDDLSQRAIITDPEFSKSSLQIQTGDNNPDRLETFFRYKRSAFARISSTTGEAGFSFGLTS